MTQHKCKDGTWKAGKAKHCEVCGPKPHPFAIKVKW